MFRTILVPVDLSDRHARALETAAALALAHAARVVLLHVIELIPGLSLEEEREFYERLESMAQERLGAFAEPLAERKVPLEAAVVFGERAHEAIVRHATAVGSDLIVLASERVEGSGDAGGGWGRVVYGVGFLSTCPVLLVR